MTELDQEKLEYVRDQTIQNEVFMDLLTNKIADVALQKFEAAHERTQKRTTLFLTLGVGLLVTAGTGFLSYFVSKTEESVDSRLTTNAQIVVQEAKSAAASVATDAATRAFADFSQKAQTIAELEVRKAVDAEVVQAKRNWERVNRGLELTSLANRITEKEAYSEAEARNALALLKQFAQDGEHEKLSQFPTALQGMVASYAAAGRDDFIVQLEPLFGELMTEIPDIAATMTVSLGYKAIAFPVEPQDLGDGKYQAKWTDLVQRYDRYAGAARNLGYPELPYFFDVVIACMEQEPPVLIEKLADTFSDLSEDDQVAGLELIRATFTESWRKESDAETARARQRSVECFGEYKTSERSGTIAELLPVGQSDSLNAM